MGFKPSVLPQTHLSRLHRSVRSFFEIDQLKQCKDDERGKKDKCPARDAESEERPLGFRAFAGTAENDLNGVHEWIVGQDEADSWKAFWNAVCWQILEPHMSPCNRRTE